VSATTLLHGDEQDEHEWPFLVIVTLTATVDMAIAKIVLRSARLVLPATSAAWPQAREDTPTRRHADTQAKEFPPSEPLGIVIMAGKYGLRFLVRNQTVAADAKLVAGKQKFVRPASLVL